MKKKKGVSKMRKRFIRHYLEKNFITVAGKVNIGLGTTISKQSILYRYKIQRFTKIAVWLLITPVLLIPSSKCYAQWDAYTSLPLGFNSAESYGLQHSFPQGLQQIYTVCPGCVDINSFKQGLGLTGINAVPNALSSLGWKNNPPPTLEMLNVAGNQFSGQQPYPGSWDSTFPGSTNNSFNPSPNFVLTDPTFNSVLGYNSNSNLNFSAQFLNDFNNMSNSIVSPNPNILGNSGISYFKTNNSLRTKTQSASTMDSQYFKIKEQQLNFYFTDNSLSNLRAEANKIFLLFIYTDPLYMYWDYRLRYFTALLYSYFDSYTFITNLSNKIASWKPSHNKKILKERFLKRLQLNYYNARLKYQVQDYFLKYPDEREAFSLVSNYLIQRFLQKWESHDAIIWANDWEKRFKHTHDNSEGFINVLETFEKFLSDYPALEEYLSLNNDIVNLSKTFEDFPEVEHITKMIMDVLSDDNVAQEIANHYNSYITQVFNVLLSSNVFAEMERYYENLTVLLFSNETYQEFTKTDSQVLNNLQELQRIIHDYLNECSLDESCINEAQNELNKDYVKDYITSVAEFYERYNIFWHHFYNSNEYLALENESIQQVQKELTPIINDLRSAQIEYINKVSNIPQVKALYDAMKDLIVMLRNGSSEFDQKLVRMSELVVELQKAKTSSPITKGPVADDH